MKIDLNLFTVFEAIYTEGSLTQAGKRLNLTQPAISHALSRLRERLDDPLFERHGHRMRPTPMAQNLMPEVQTALKQLNSALQKAHIFDASVSDKTYCLAMRDIIESTMLPPMIQTLSERAPKVRLASVRIERKEMAQKLASGEVDFAVDILLPNQDNIKHRKLIEDDLVILTNKSHHASGTAINESEYLKAKHILVSTRASGPNLVDYALSTSGLERDIGLRCQHYYAACQVVNKTDLVLTMPKHYAQVLVQHFDNIEVHPLPFNSGNIDMHLYWHQNRDTDAANVWFREFIDETIGNWVDV
jgi:DNA-binding transcriptional LysR family regulator